MIDNYKLYTDKDGNVSIWKLDTFGQGNWFKWMLNTPKNYADSVAKFRKTKPDYGPCFYGMHGKPEDYGLTFLGVFKAVSLNQAQAHISHPKISG